jgi:hypothetical protein
MSKYGNRFKDGLFWTILLKSHARKYTSRCEAIRNKQDEMIFGIIRRGKKDHLIFVYQNIIFMALMTKNGTFLFSPQILFLDISYRNQMVLLSILFWHSNCQ